MSTSAMPSPGGADAGVISSSGGGDYELSSFLSGAFDSASEAAESGQNAPDTQGTEAQLDQQIEELGDPSLDTSQPVQPGQTQPKPGEQAPADSPYGLSPDGKFYQVPKGELSTLQTARKFHEQVGKYFSSPQEAEQAHQQAQSLRLMSNDWTSGSPDSLQIVLNHWAGMDHAGNPALQQRYQQSFAQMAQMMPDMLSRINPQAHAQFVGQPARFDAQGQLLSPASGMLLKAVDVAYQRAAQSGNPADFKHAQETDFAITGTYKNELPQQNPQAQLSAREQQMQQFEQRQATAMKREADSFYGNALEGNPLSYSKNSPESKFGKLDSMIEKVLAPVKGRYQEATFNDMKDGIQRDVVAKIRSDNPDFFVEHSQEFNGIMSDFRQLWQNGQNAQQILAPRINAYHQNFLRQVQRVLQSVAQPRVRAATKTEVNRTQNGQFAANQPPTRPAAAPSQSANGNQPNGRMPADQWDAELAAALRV